MSWPIVYGVKHKNEDVRMNSRSGGIFTALSDYVLEHDGVVYGCILNDNLKAVHVRATTKLERDKMRGSKYVQSNLGNVFYEVKTDLKSGKLVLFSGTSCQVDGLKRYLGMQHDDHLLCIDIVCHGVPSPLVLKKYIEWQEKKNKAKCRFIDFRNKEKFGWADHAETLYMVRDSDSFKIDSRVFRDLFYEHTILRPSCYKCPYKSVMHPSDITIADFWGIDAALPEFNDNKGVSLVLINNSIGHKWFTDVMPDIIVKESKIEDAMQPPLKESFPEPVYRKVFWSDFFKFPFGLIVEKYTYHGFLKRFERLIKKIIK